MQLHACTYPILTHTLDTWGVVKGQTFLSESSHVACQINGNGSKTSMQAYILSLHTPSTPGVWSKVKHFYLKVVMSHVKLMGMDQRPACKHIFCPYTQPRLPDGVKRSKHFFIPGRSRRGLVLASSVRQSILQTV